MYGRYKSDLVKLKEMNPAPGGISDGWIIGTQYDLKDFNMPWRVGDILKQERRMPSCPVLVPVQISDASESFHFLTDKEEYEEAEAKFESFPPPQFLKISSDHGIYYGDGGFSHMCYPVWVGKPSITEDTRLALTEDLLTLAENRQDKHLKEPVTDIIDPDLFPYRLPNNQANQKLKKLVLGKYKSSYRKAPPVESLSKATTTRASYTWIPSEVIIQHSGSEKISQFLSPIHNLPHIPQNTRLYRNINKVFTQCIPLLENLNLVRYKKGKPTKLQVIVKSQTYAIPPGSTYSGVWHTEGLLENIVAAIVYYCNIDNGLSGGQLKFRPENVPSSGYSEEDPDRVVDVESGYAVGFSNWIPHRVRKMVNRTSETQHRTFLNFFIVDPALPLKSTKTELPISSWVILLHQMFRHHTGSSPPKEIVGMLMILLDQWPSVEVAKEFREMTREQMKLIKSGWGVIHYGNCGKQEWVDNSEISPKDCSRLSQTDSVTD
eukprot:TRINITY_DN6367_c0_g1_i1.p1 TRINITY_DN6367_c0_g1~~TRINITY_DN6367_c0_g1_i1.p1  ORF type:complete len:499 (-),score=115.72 TRINITY_DN6367_c0_g1_i1:76-1548(-)